jgi:hypothetical protein
MKLSEHRNSKKQGDAGLGIAIGWFAEEGYTVNVPLTDSQDYDLIVDTDGKLQRVQVKTATRHRYGGWVVELRTRGGNRSGTGKSKQFDPRKVDLLFVVTSERSIFLIPSEEVTGRSTVTVGSKYQEFKVVARDHVPH